MTVGEVFVRLAFAAAGVGLIAFGWWALYRLRQVASPVSWEWIWTLFVATSATLLAQGSVAAAVLIAGAGGGIIAVGRLLCRRRATARRDRAESDAGTDQK